MSVPGIVQSTLEGETVATSVSLGGEDELFVTPSRTIVYRAEGLLSDESAEEFPHEADRLVLSEGRRKTRIALEYPLEGTREFTVPAERTDAVLHPVLAGLLSGNGITAPGETVEKSYRFSELTVIVTSERLVKHVGEAVWDDDYEAYHFDDVTNLSFEEGRVATQIVLGVGDRQQRIKAPNEEAADVRERLERALFAYHDVTSLEELNERGRDESEEGSRNDPVAAFGDGVGPIGSHSSDGESGAVSAAETTKSADENSFAGSLEASGFEPASPQSDRELLERLEALEETVARQTALLERQQETIERLIEELRLGR